MVENIVIIYLISNVLGSIISRAVVLYYDEKYWKKNVTGDEFLLVMILLTPAFVITTFIRRVYGFVRGFLSVFVTIPETLNKIEMLILKGLDLIVDFAFYVPVFVCTTIYEIKLKIRANQDG